MSTKHQNHWSKRWWSSTVVINYSDIQLHRVIHVLIVQGTGMSIE